jgi:hypothetical protein
LPATSRLEGALKVARVDWSPRHRLPSPVTLLIATSLSLAGSIGSDALLVFIGTRLFPSTRGYVHFRFSDYATLTTIGVLVASAAWPIVTRVSSAPRWLFLRLAVLVTLGLWIPDVWLLVILHEPARAVSVLMAMHLAIAVVTYNLLVRVAPVREGRAPGSPRQSGASPEPLEVDQEKPPPNPRKAAERSAGRLATTLSVLVGIDFVLGILALFSLSSGRPSGWLPGKGVDVYLAHAIVGLVLTLGAVTLVLRVRGGARVLRMAGWMGGCGVAIAGAGGVLAVYHSLRLFGMALMFVGPLIAGFAYLIPLIERTPAKTPPYN